MAYDERRAIGFLYTLRRQWLALAANRPSHCVRACPYGARFFNTAKQVSEKCAWCYRCVTKGLQPAWVEVCPVGARIFGDLKDKESPISRFVRDNRVEVLRPETGNAPNVFYVGIDKEVS